MSKGVLPLYYSPLTQVVLLGLVCLCCPGMFNALSGLGAGGSMSSNVGLIDSANGALYGCFAIVGFFSGTFTNTVGVKHTLTVMYTHIFDCFSFFFFTDVREYRLVQLVMLFIVPLYGSMTENKFQGSLLQQVLFLVAVLVYSGLHKVRS